MCLKFRIYIHSKYVYQKKEFIKKGKIDKYMCLTFDVPNIY
jgi:hypothetical protein